MRILKPKQIGKLRVKGVRKAGEKPAAPVLSKSHPDYFAAIGRISASRRKLSSEDMSEMAKLSHGPKSKRDGYHGGRKKKTDGTGTPPALA